MFRSSINQLGFIMIQSPHPIRNSLAKYVLSRNIISDITDQYKQFCVLQSAAHLFPKKSKIRDYPLFTEQHFLSDLQSFNWDTGISYSANLTKPFPFQTLSKLL